MAGETGLRHLASGEGRKLLLLGDVRTVKLSGAETGGALTIVEQAVEPGAGSALHRHPYLELFYVLEGELEFATLESGERTVFRAGPGSTVHAASLVPHAYRNAGSRPARFLAVMQPAGAEGFFAEVGLWLDDAGPQPPSRPVLSADELRAAAARHGIEFLPDP